MAAPLQQRSFNGDTPRILNSNEPHMACLFLLDTSGSMGVMTNSGKRAIDELVDGLNRFKTEVCEDPQTRAILDVAIVEFNSDVNVVQDFVPVEYMETVSLEANGGTAMTAGLRTAIDMIVERGRFYHNTSVPPYLPWIIMITDGYPSDSIEGIAEEIMSWDKQDKLRLWALAVKGADTNLLNRLCNGKRVFALDGYNFTGFFDWAHKSMRSISSKAPGESPEGQPLPDDVKIVTSWMK